MKSLGVGWMDDPYRVSYQWGSSPASSRAVSGCGSDYGVVLAIYLVYGVSATGIVVFGIGYVVADSISSRIWLSASVMQFALVVPSLVP